VRSSAWGALAVKSAHVLQEAVEYCLGFEPVAGLHAGDQTVAPELLLARVACFGHAVAAHDDEIAGLELERARLVGRVSEQAEHEPAGSSERMSVRPTMTGGS